MEKPNEQMTSETIAQSVLKLESSAILQLSEEVPHCFGEVVSKILSLPGRVVVSGMGKSGLIAAKIAATLASTGTPAQYVHPGEASHGDLGMITKSDCVILISNSGETKELSDIIAHCTRFAVPMIGITKNISSTLALAADYLLNVPDAPEACAIGMAPTTSTILAMALGDALAVALMNSRGFKREDFLTLHPGGTLGVKLLKVSAVMHRGDAIPTVTPSTSMNQTLLTMTQKGFGATAVVKDGKLVGAITDGDLRRNIDGLFDYLAGDVATKDPVCIDENAFLTEALGLMNSHNINALMVKGDDGGLAGFLHIHDLLRVGVA